MPEPLLLPAPAIVDAPALSPDQINAALELDQDPPADKDAQLSPQDRAFLSPEKNPDDQVSDPESARIRAALEKHGGNQSAAARELGLSRSALQRRMRRMARHQETSRVTSRSWDTTRAREAAQAMRAEREQRTRVLEDRIQQLEKERDAVATEGLDQGFALILEFVFGSLATVRGSHWKMSEEQRQLIAKPLAAGAAPLLGEAAQYMPLITAVSGIGAHVIGAIAKDRELSRLPPHARRPQESPIITVNG